MFKRYQEPGGFTLVEVLIALSIIAFALAAIIGASASVVNNYARLQEKTFAHWVAMNKLTEIHATRQWPVRKTSGTMMMAGHEWHWETDVEKLPAKVLEQKLRKVTVRVKLNEDDEYFITSLSGFAGWSQ